MTLVCHQCGSAVAAADAFCRVCGARQRPASTGPAAGDRRQLTVMFCDLVDSTATAARLDPEDVQTVLGAYQQLAADVVRNVDGHVAQYLGDGLLIYLGFPAAHEDDPARAVSAALEIAREVPRLGDRLAAMLPDIRPGELLVRIGIHTGPVVVGAVGSQARSEQLALGSTVNLAARLAAEAEPGTVMISEATARRTSGVFVIEALGLRQLKGLPAPVAAFRPTAPRGIRSRIAAWRGGSGRILLGRDVPLGQLLAEWSAASSSDPAAAAKRSLVILRGEAGIGKSRLLQALRQRLGDEPHGWISCHGSALQQVSAFYPVIEAMRDSLGLDGGEPPAEARQRLADAFADTGYGENIDQLATLLGFGEERGDQTLADRELAIAALVKWLLRLAQNKPLVVAVEDLHWFDPSSVELISRLSAAAQEAPVFIVGTMRPEWVLPWPDAAVIDLPPLATGDIAAIVSQIVGADAASETVAALVARSDGVPLYAEELAQAFVEQVRQGDERAGVPASLQDSIMARLDRLGVNKQLAQVGALLGRSFSHEQIAAVTGLDDSFLAPGLAEIAARGILQRDGIPPRATYSFRHALLQDAAAASLLRQQYRQINGRIAAVLVDRFASVARDNPVRVAQHYAEAGAVPDAIAWYRRAGEQARQRAAYREAETAYERAIALAELAPAGDEDDAVGALYAEMGRILQMTQGYAAPATRQALARARRPHSEVRDRALLQREREEFQATLTRGAYAEARAKIESVVRRWQGDADDPFFVFFRLGASIQIAYFTGDLASVEPAFAEMEPWIDGHGHTQPAGNTISAIGIACLAAAWRGDSGEAHRRIARALDFADRTGDPYDLAMALHYLSSLHLIERNAEAAMPVGAQLQNLAEAQGFAYLAALVRGLMGWVATQFGEFNGNAARMRATLDALIAAGALIALPTHLNRLAEVELLEGSPEAALATIEQALALNREEDIYRPASLLIRARITLLTDARAAETDLAEALTLSERMGAHGVALPIANMLARLQLARGETARARAVLIARLETGGGNAADIAEMHALLARLQPAAVAVQP